MHVMFRQYLRPHGVHMPITTEVADKHKDKVEAILAKGLKFEAEVLTNGFVSITIADPVRAVDVAIAICKNNEEVTAAIDKIITNLDLATIP